MRESATQHFLDTSKVSGYVTTLVEKPEISFSESQADQISKIVTSAIQGAHHDRLGGIIFPLSFGGRSFEMTFLPEVSEVSGWIQNSVSQITKGSTTLLWCAVVVILQMLADRHKQTITYKFSTSYQKLEEWMEKIGKAVFEPFMEDSDLQAPGLVHAKKFKVVPGDK